MSTSRFSIGKLLKWFLISLTIIGFAFITYFILSGRKAVQMVFPDLEDIYYVNAVIRHDSAYTNLHVVLQNKNPYPLNIDTLSFDVKLNDTSIAAQTVPLNIRQTSFKSDTIGVRLDLSMKKIQKLLKHLKDTDSTTAEIKGYAIYKTFLGRKKFHFENRKNIATPIPPRIKLVSLTREKFDLKTKTLRTKAKLEIINDGNRIDAELYDFKYDLNINDELHSKGSLNKTVQVKPRSKAFLDVPMLIKVDHPLKTKLLIITDRDRLPFDLLVTFTVKERVSQKKYNSPVELKVSGKMELEK